MLSTQSKENTNNVIDLTPATKAKKAKQTMTFEQMLVDTMERRLELNHRTEERLDKVAARKAEELKNRAEMDRQLIELVSKLLTRLDKVE